MPTTHIPKFPVVDQSPSLSKTFANFRTCDFLLIGGLGVVGNAVGWLGGNYYNS